MKGKLAKFVSIVQLGLQLIAGTGGCYFAMLTVATFLRPLTATKEGSHEPRFAVIVPAHNEEQVIARTLESLRDLDYTPERYEVFVVADNCLDSTAEIARRFDCTVWERTDPIHRSKGHALSWAFAKIPEDYEAFVIMDADSTADPRLLTTFSREYDPSLVLQSRVIQYSGPSAVSAVSYVASAVHNVLKPWGRECLGLSAGLGGTGMCIPRAFLENLPWQRFGLSEDHEYHLSLVLAGRRACFAPEACVQALGPHNFKGLHSQRLRWERGRVATIRHFAGPLLERFITKRDVRSLEAFVSTLAPPLSPTVMAAAGCIVLGIARRSPGGLAVGALGLLMSAGAILRALQMVQAPARIYVYLLALPPFVVWRAYVSLSTILQSTGREWVRTERSGQRV
jgi:cellulose synthase/poly-beta-1,6-N-acetylglucosamine synthase-like glycosyltransferase